MQKIIILIILLIVIKFIWFNKKKEGFACENLAPNSCNADKDCEWIRRECRNISSSSCD